MQQRDGQSSAIIASFRGVERRFGDHLAVGPLNLDIRRGEFLSLLGPSGSGKSTALRLLAGLLTPSAGIIAWQPKRPRIGFVFQDPTLMPWTTARANVRLPLDLERVPRREADKQADEALCRVGLAGFGDTYPRALSGGMRMRVSIARALVAKPEVLLMDEPFAALDEIARESLNEDLLKLWREDQLTIVFVTHSVYESAFLATRVVVLTPRPGRVAAAHDLRSPPVRSRDWRMTPQFTADAREISTALRQAMGTT